MASTKLTVTPQIRRRTSPPSIHPQPLAKPATPTIQVTIGQIEVRATPSPSPAKKPAPSTPIMSLDEYLRQRNGRQL
jgi:hypothetical protein